MLKRCLAVCLAVIAFLSYSQNIPVNYIDKIKLYLDKDNALSGYYRVDTGGVSIYASPEAKSLNKVELRFLWKDTIGYQRNPVHREDADSLLKGYRIALDPGHLADDMEMAKLERKYIEIKKNPGYGLDSDVRIIESELTYETAALLKGKLENAGAAVLISRPRKTDFNAWMKSSFRAAVDSAYTRHQITGKEKNFLLTKATTTEIFRSFFLNWETRDRATRINSYHPDFTIIIHYNADEKNSGWKKPTDKDFNMAFVGGSFLRNELNLPESRAEFLRLIVSGDLSNSFRFSSFFIRSFEKNLDVPAAKMQDADYLQSSCLPTPEPGVFCRNLMLTRLVHGTLVYGETLYQDNIRELKLLTKKDRVAEVANAYYEAIVNYIK